MKQPNRWSDLPGGEILRDGLRDLAEELESVPALLVRIAEPRLTRLGIEVPASRMPSAIADELRLYRLLRARSADAYAEYNAWLRDLASLCDALELRAGRARRAAGGD
jgi:hypothetical protein